MTTQYNDSRTSITVEIVRDDKFNEYMADNKHLRQTATAAYAPVTQASSLVTSASALVRDSYERGVFDGLLYDQLQYEHYEAFAQMLDDEELERDEIEDIYLDSFIKPDIRGMVRNRIISDKKFNGWFRGNTHRRNAKRNRMDVSWSRSLNAMRRDSKRREMTEARA